MDLLYKPMGKHTRMSVSDIGFLLYYKKSYLVIGI